MINTKSIPTKIISSVDRAALVASIKFHIRNSDATLIIVSETPIKVTDGTVLTVEKVRSRKKPYLIIDLSKDNNFDLIIN